MTAISRTATPIHRTLADGWALAELHTPEGARRPALPAFPHDDHHRPHTAIGNTSPITRLNTPAGHHSWPEVRAAADGVGAGGGGQ
ncbi:hypothetical protein [Actinoplanes teichomyceticus]|uniref:hypothetical protein n=1 Tax=Actinoplanes teichomyceticus TaxID=1867 RepID=UPI000F0A08E9|nr:hypothetical protein Ate01nite_42100 [Actinoplanes teichomyceticus]